MSNTRIVTVETIKEVVATLAEQYGAERVYLFGSYARGEETQDSDVDLRVDIGGIADLYEFSALISDLEEMLGLSIDLLDSESIPPWMLLEIEKDQVLLYESKR